MTSSDVSNEPDATNRATAAAAESLAAAASETASAAPAGGFRTEFAGMLREVGDLLELQLALFRTEWRLCSAALKRLLLWTPLLLMLGFTLLLTVISAIGWAVYHWTGSVLWGFVAAGGLQILIVLAGVLSIKRLLRDSSFPRTRNQLRDASAAVKNLTGGMGS